MSEVRYCTCGHASQLHERAGGIIDPCTVDGCECYAPDPDLREVDNIRPPSTSGATMTDLHDIHAIDAQLPDGYEIVRTDSLVRMGESHAEERRTLQDTIKRWRARAEEAEQKLKPREITTDDFDELLMLPLGSVIQEVSDPEYVYRKGKEGWNVVNEEWDYDVNSIDLPVIVLWEPR